MPHGHAPSIQCGMLSPAFDQAKACYGLAALPPSPSKQRNPAHDRSNDATTPVLPKQGMHSLLVCLFSMGLSSLSYAEEMLHWKDAWVRSMPPGAQVSAAYGMLMNHSDQTVTVSTVSSEISGTAEMHEVIAEGDQRRMAELESIDIAPHETLIFEPGGRHIMLLDIAAPPIEG
ncbi:MAG: hypothetical protein CM15mP103_11870 [Gammaproteobacteria bacterium]|nr:MAG: hypothetical protein CM15mP103_11870 [Gammaproteobacteria bacterium]